MKIQSVQLHFLSMKLVSPFVTSFGTIDERTFFVVEMIDEAGRIGWGECVAFPLPGYTNETQDSCYDAVRDLLIPKLLGQTIRHPDEVGTLFEFIPGHPMAKSALEGAVWDLYAQNLKISLAQAVGGTRTRIASGISIGFQDSDMQLLDAIKQAVSQGYKRVKLKIKREGDLALLEAVRRHFPDLALTVDANGQYTLADVDHLKKFDTFKLLMIEQPLENVDLAQNAILQAQIETPICLDESIQSFADAKQAISLGACKVMNIKIGRIGGISETIKIHNLCARHHIPVWCGGMLESGIGRAHNIAIASLANFSIPGDISASSRYWHEDIITPEIMIENGEIPIPRNKPGIGFEVHGEKLKKFTIKTISF